MLKKIVLSVLQMPNTVCNYWNLKRKKVSYGSDLTIAGRISLHGNGKITIGDHVTILSAPGVNPTAGGTRTFLDAKAPGELIIGNNVGMSHAVIRATEKVEIEDNVLLGSCVKIWDSDFHSVHYNERVCNGDIGAISKPVRIEEGAFIGACSIILKGVTIGKHAVIAAGSVVTRDVPANEIWGGNPARFIKSLRDEDMGG